MWFTGMAIQSSKSATTVVGRSLSGKSRMNRSNRLVVLAVALVAGTAQAESVVYDSTVDLSGAGAVGMSQVGNEVILAGTERTLVRAEFRMVLTSYPATTDLQVHVYLNDAVNGQPGTELWKSGWIQGVLFQGPQVVPVDIPNVQVPDRITVTIEEVFIGGVQAQELLARSTTVGTTERVWLGSPGSWQIWTVDPVAIRLTAVPEPATLSLLALGGVALIRRRR